MRIDGRKEIEIRSCNLERGIMKYAEGSCLITIGDTKVLCCASVEEKVPPFLVGSGQSRITAEYTMLPRATQTRHAREGITTKVNGRSQEIQRLIGRSMRTAVDLSSLGERTIILDCDVLQADGGTRTASITGCMVALVDALRTLKQPCGWQRLPILQFVAAISLGKVNDRLLLDLCYMEDSHAGVDMNLVMTENGSLVEIQGTAEGAPYTQEDLLTMLAMGKEGIQKLISIQKECLYYQEGE